MGIAEEQPMLRRLDRLENMVRRVEEMKGSGGLSPSSPSTVTSEGQHSSSLDASPKSNDNLCLPIHRVILETELKGTLLHRLHHLEDRLLKLCLQLEQELQAAERKTDEEEDRPKKQKGLKKLVNKVIRAGGSKHHTHHPL